MEVIDDVIRNIVGEAAEAMKNVDPDLLAYGLTGMLEIMTLRTSLDEKYRVEDIIEFIVDLALKPLLLMKSPDYVSEY